MNNIKSFSISLVAVSFLGLTFVGCGDSGSSSTSTTPTTNTAPAGTTVSTGTFVDAPVQGLHYITATQDGYTNASGQYHYVEGETVQFMLGNLSLGTATAGTLMTPYTLAGTTSASPNTTSTNIAMLLQDFDGDRANSTMIDVTKLKDYSFSGVNINAPTSEMDIQLATMLSTASFQSYVDEMDHDPIEASVAQETMRRYVDAVSR